MVQLSFAFSMFFWSAAALRMESAEEPPMSIHEYMQEMEIHTTPALLDFIEGSGFGEHTYDMWLSNWSEWLRPFVAGQPDQVRSAEEILSAYKVVFKVGQFQTVRSTYGAQGQELERIERWNSLDDLMKDNVRPIIQHAIDICANREELDNIYRFHELRTSEWVMLDHGINPDIGAYDVVVDSIVALMERILYTSNPEVDLFRRIEYLLSDVLDRFRESRRAQAMMQGQMERQGLHGVVQVLARNDLLPLSHVVSDLFSSNPHLARWSTEKSATESIEHLKTRVADMLEYVEKYYHDIYQVSTTSANRLMHMFEQFQLQFDQEQ